LPSITADHMLVRLIRSPSLQIARQASDGAFPRCCKQPLRSSFCGHCAQPACSVKTSAISDPTEIWPQDLKAQILQSATKIRFRYEVDSHKLHSDATLDRAEKAIGYGIFHLQKCRSEFSARRVHDGVHNDGFEVLSPALHTGTGS